MTPSARRRYSFSESIAVMSAAYSIAGPQEIASMIDFQKNAVFKLSPVSVEKTFPPISKFLIEGETILSAFQKVRDQLGHTPSWPPSPMGFEIRVR